MAIKPHRVLALSYIGNAIRNEGDIVEYEENDAGDNLELIGEKTKAADGAVAAKLDVVAKSARKNANAAQAVADTHPGDPSLAVAAQEAEEVAKVAESASVDLV